jgi:hypothetical protein
MDGASMNEPINQQILIEVKRKFPDALGYAIKELEAIKVLKHRMLRVKLFILRRKADENA